ncbi:MAG: ATP-binding cassette domain-containing protein [Pseudomonadota bacterium]
MLGQNTFIHPRHLGLLLASSLAVNTLALALPLMTMQIYDRVLSNRAEDTLLVLSVGVMIAACVECTLRICRSMMVGLNGAHFEHDAAVRALGKVLEAEPRAIGSTTPSVIAQDIGAAARLKDYFGGQMMVTLLIDSPFIIVFLALEAYLAGWLVVVPCAVLALFLLMSWHQGVQVRELIDARENHDDARYSFITQALQVVHTIKTFCLEASMARRFEEVQRESGQTNYALACKHGQAGSLSYGFSQAMTVAVICAGAPQVMHGHITVGTLIACVLLSGQVMQPLQRGLAMWIRFQDIALAKERLTGLMELPPRPFLLPEKMAANHGALRLDKVRFSYADGVPVLDGASLAVAPGDMVGITGASGSGKTTLLELMAGIAMPDRGSVTLSGMAVAGIPMAERDRYIAHLSMSGLILRGSIMDNLTGFRPELRAQARHVADQLGIEDAVALLPAGYDTPLEGHTTDVVSPGLKQRISIARALLHKPRLILFENADHGMDHDSYSRIFALLARLKGKATMVVVSEDRNILSLVDHIYDLRHGQLTAMSMPSMLVNDRRIVRGASA